MLLMLFVINSCAYKTGQTEPRKGRKTRKETVINNSEESQTPKKKPSSTEKSKKRSDKKTRWSGNL